MLPYILPLLMLSLTLLRCCRTLRYGIAFSEQHMPLRLLLLFIFAPTLRYFRYAFYLYLLFSPL